MEITRRRSERAKVKKATYTPGKLVTKARNKIPPEVKDNWVDYNLNRKKAVNKKLEAAERDFTVKTEIKPVNLVLIFSAAAYVEFKIITKTVINNSDLSIDTTDTRDKTGAVVSESLAVRKGNTQIFVLNFYNTSSKVLLNGNQLYIIDFITSSLSDILGILDRNEQFKEINNQIRDYCKTYLDSTCTNEINQEGQNEKQTYKPMCSGISQSTDRTQDNDTLVNTQSPKQMQPINSKTTHNTIRIPSIESNQSKEKTIFQEMQDTDIQYRNDNIQNVDYLCQKCGKNCD